MFDIMTTAENAIQAYNNALKVSSTNIANLNVPGYKKLSISFQSIFERVLSQGSAAESGQGGTNPRQLGQGMSIANTWLDMSGGSTTTGNSLDLAISGNGFFIVSADGGSSFLYTRVGNFLIDASGNLTANGLQVYGLNNSGAVTPISGLPSGNPSSYRWQSDGTLQYSSDGVNYVSTGYRIALTYFANSSGLAQAQGTSFAETLASGSPATPSPPGGSYGILQTGQIEQSNVNYLSETINSLELQRALSANLNMVKMASDLITSFIQKLG